MKTILSLVVSLQLAALGAVAQEHDHEAMLRDYLKAHSEHGPVVPQPDLTVQPTAAKTFNIVARTYEFDVTPSNFVVDQGDVVTINISVPSNDANAAGGHGIIMDTYIEHAVSVSNGQTKQITFTATTIGNFSYACSVTTCGSGSPGHFDMTGTFTVRPATLPAPQVSSVTPNNGPLTGGTPVTIAGINFQTGATVKFGGVSASNVLVVSSGSITATTPPHAAGTIDVVVTNPDGQSGSVIAGFTFTVPGPTIASITPDNGPTSGNTLVTITGTGFQSGATVTIGGVAATNVTVVDSTTITARTPLGPANEQLGKKDVVVTNPNATKATLAQAFLYTVPPLAVALITPQTSPPAGGVVVTITGAGFTTAVASSVTFGGVAATNVQVLNAVTMRATAPAHAVGLVNVVVTVGSNSVTATNGFSYANSTPRRRAVSH